MNKRPRTDNSMEMEVVANEEDVDVHNEIEEEECNDEEEDDEKDDCADEDEETEGSGQLGEKSRRGRSVTLQMLMADGTLQPGESAMSVEYLGRKFVSDLLPDGTIRWQENNEMFSSPSAWASHCKRLLNPDKKSGCGWASIKYKGKKLDLLKTLWIEKHNKGLNEDVQMDISKQAVNGASIDANNAKTVERNPEQVLNPTQEDKNSSIRRRPVLKHFSLGLRATDRDPNTLVECTPFCALGKIQPFTLTVTTSCLLLMDFHCHLTTSEVVGYLAGFWDVNAHNLAIQYAFPCKCRLGDKENSVAVEQEIRQAMEKRNLMLVGWYHSHPSASVHPTLRDIDCQMDYQIKLKGDSDACYTPCVGVICAPYDKDCKSLESSVQAYWVMPPPEHKPNEYGKPMLMTFSLIQEKCLSTDIQQEMINLLEYYANAPDLIDFNSQWEDDINYMEKLEKSLSQKALLDQKTDNSIKETLKSVFNSKKSLN